MKIRENRLMVLRQMQPDRWYEKAELQDAELFLLQRMTEEGLLESRFDHKQNRFTYRLKPTLQHA